MSEAKQRTGRELLNALRRTAINFYPCDLHSHSLGSYDVCQVGRFEKLPDTLRALIPKVINSTGKYHLPLMRQPASIQDYDQTVANTELVKVFYDAISERRNQLVASQGISDTDNWCLLGITDHNTSHFACALSKMAWGQRQKDKIIIFPGIELDVAFTVPNADHRPQVHILCLFAPETTPSDMRLAIDGAIPNSDGTWDFGKHLNLQSLAEFVKVIRSHKSFPAICIAAHIWTSKGVQNEHTKAILEHHDAEIARYEGELARAIEDIHTTETSEIREALEKAKLARADKESIDSDVLRLIGNCGFDALQVKDKSHERHYRRLHRFRDGHGRSVPIISSDAHSPDQLFNCSSGVPFVKLPSKILSKGTPKQLFEELRDRALRFGETRTTYVAPKCVSNWIEGIEIARDSKFASLFFNDSRQESPDNAPFTLELSQNLNCLIGGRGAGKSATIDAIAFIANPDSFSEEAKKVAPAEWYARAKATLAGCHVRVVWKTTSQQGFGGLPKRSLIVSRYFDPEGNHLAVEMRDCNDQAVVDSSIDEPRIRILRVHDIESTAEEKKLNALFDDLCGPEIKKYNQEINDRRLRLSEQRKEIMACIRVLSTLACDGSALMQYGVRKWQYDLVNKPELQQRFAEVDAASETVQRMEAALNSWKDLMLAKELERLSQEVKEFWSSDQGHSACFYQECVIEPTDHGASLRTEVPSNPKETSTSPLMDAANSVINSLLVALKDVNMFDSQLASVHADAIAQLTSKKDSLAAEGIPAGASERLAKKNAFDEAKNALAAYDTEIATLDSLLASRVQMHNDLLTTIEHRTRYRQEVANEITRSLARDLDANVLQITLQTLPQEDKTELEDWLECNFGPAIAKYRQHRLAALVQSNCTPNLLRIFLLNEGEPDLEVITNSHVRAEDGKIDLPLASQLFNRCRGVHRVDLDHRNLWEGQPAFDLPTTIKDGVRRFPYIEGKSTDFCIEQILKLDEIVLNDAARVLLNDRPNDGGSIARPLEELSPGQRCSAILPILLLCGDYPLIIDQPEENLDNRLIRQVVVNILASMKLNRQIILATHNPNLPVLGDAEQCVILHAKGQRSSEVRASGSLDSPVVSSYITDIMEGGREAFQYRQAIYQHHWRGVIASNDEGNLGVRD